MPEFLEDAEKMTVAERELLLDKMEAEIPNASRRFAPLYQSLDWKWKRDDKEYIPEIHHLSKRMRELIQFLRENDSDYVSGGGLAVWIDERAGGISFEPTEHVYLD